MNLLEQVRIKNVAPLTSAGNTDLAGNYVIDTKDCDGVLFIAGFGALASTAIVGLTPMHSNSTSTTDMVAMSTTINAHTSAASTDDSFGIMALDVYRPTKRYLNINVEKATAACTVNSLIAISYGLRKLPSVQSTGIADTAGGAGVLDSEVVVSPTT